MPATRIVIDVQPQFGAANRPNLVIGVTLELIRAMKERAHIVIVEYGGHSPTHRGLMDLLKGYPKLHKITKNNDDGSKEVVEYVRRKRIKHDHLRVCGVNTDCCVLATINGLLPKLPATKIEVVKSACDWSGSGRFDWRRYPKKKNLSLVA